MDDPRYRHAVATRILTTPERAAARLVTGPLGHLYGGVADWATLLARYAWARAHGRRLT
jgi:hypothetical protein